MQAVAAPACILPEGALQPPQQEIEAGRLECSRSAEGRVLLRAAKLGQCAGGGVSGLSLRAIAALACSLPEGGLQPRQKCQG